MEKYQTGGLDEDAAVANLPVSFGRLHCVPVLTALASRHPALRLDVTFADRRVDLADEGIDLVVRLGDPGDQASLSGWRVAWQRSVICASPAYLDRHGRPQTIADLSRHDCLAFAQDGRPLPWMVLADDGAVRALTVKARHAISHGEALRDAAVSGLGLACLSTWLTGGDIRDGRLEALPLPHAGRAVADLGPVAPLPRAVTESPGRGRCADRSVHIASSMGSDVGQTSPTIGPYRETPSLTRRATGDREAFSTVPLIFRH